MRNSLKRVDLENQNSGVAVRDMCSYVLIPKLAG